MFGRYDKSSSLDENDTENWSFPYERFSTINVPKSRLGKRRTITSSNLKRDVLEGLSSDSNNVSKEEKDGTSTFSQGPSLTHPVNSYLTPTQKRLNKFENYVSQNKFGQDMKNAYDKLGGITPFRKNDSGPLKELKNFLNDPKVTPGSVSNPQSNQNSQVDGDSAYVSSNIQRVLNKSFEEEGLNEGLKDENVCQSEKIVVATEPLGDSSHSDLGNNSSFMTAHDVYNIDRSRLHQESVYYKTPRKGFTFLDVKTSAGTLKTENDGLKNLLPKTPGLTKFESYKTPFSSRVVDPFSNEMFTPTLLNYPKTPMVVGNAANLNSPLMLVEKIKTDQGPNITSNLESNCLSKISPPSEDNSTFSDVQKRSPSLVQKQIFEGLGWSLPHSSISIESPPINLDSYKKQANSNPDSSVLLTPSNSSSESSHSATNICVNSEMEVDYSTNCSLSHCPKEKFPVEVISSCIQKTDASSVFDHLPSISSNDTVPVASHTKAPGKYSEENEESGRNFERYMDFSVDKSSTGNSCLNSAKSSSFIASNLSVDRINMDSINQNHNNRTLHFNSTDQSSTNGTAIESTVQLRNNYAICQEETDLLTVQNPMDDLPSDVERKDITVIAHPVAKEQKNSVSQVHEPKSCSQQLASKALSEQMFVAPQPVAPYSRPTPKPQTNVIHVKNKPYTVLSMLGRGGSSEVYQVLDTESSKLLAMKFVNLASVEESIASGYLNEIEVLSKLQGCGSVIKMFDSEYIPESKILYVVMEKGDTDFSRLMKDIMKTKKLSMSMITYYWTEMLSCVKDIHEKGIIHSDLKPANFLLVSGRLKLIDFGIASSLQGDMTSVLKDVTTGTFNYMSPEAIRNCGETRSYKITYKSDIWSLGCILYNLLYGRTPFSHLTNTWAKLGAIADPGTDVSFPTDSSAPRHLLYSVRWALRKDPKERPTAVELLQLAEITSFPDSQLGKQITLWLDEYISQTFPNCKVKLEPEKKDKMQ